MLPAAALLAFALLPPPAQSARAAQASSTQPQPEPAWMKALDRHHQQLIDRNGPGTDAALRDRLLALGEEDQRARGLVNGRPANDNATAAPDLSGVDARLTGELKQIVAERGWPTIGLVGIRASNAALLILIHSADHAWQRSRIPALEHLAQDQKIDGSMVATLVDKELVSEGRLQRYGTQFRFDNGELAMFAAEDPATLEARRARMFLPPLAAYRQQMEELYHAKATTRVVNAAP